MSYDIYTGLLKAFSLPTGEKTKTKFTFDDKDTNFNILKSKYPIETIAGDGNDFSKAVNLLGWVSSHTYHKGDFSGSIAYNSLALLDYAHDKGSSCGINCVALATILTECLLAIGLKARKVFIMPCSPYDDDKHVVTQAYIKEMNKWVMFDPTLNAYIKNEQGECLSLLELRDCLSNQTSIFFNDEAKYNDDTWTDESTKYNTEYYAKNLFYFQTSEISTFDNGNAPNNRSITLCPLGYNPKQILLSNIKYRIKIYGNDPFMQEWMEKAKKGEYAYCSSDDFEE